MNKARRSPASPIAVIARREDPWTPVFYADEAPRFPPNATIFSVERMGMAHLGRNALAAVDAHGAERGIGFGSKLRSLLRHRAHQARGTIRSLRCDLHFDLYLRSLHADRVARDASRRGSGQYGAGLDDVDGTMPGARHLLA